MPLSPGSRLGPYEITAAIGAGGMGEVYKARDTRLDRTVAIKVLPAEVSADPDRRARFQREAKTIAGLNHPHICTLHDVGDHDGSLFLVMELLAGESLRARLSRARAAVPALVGTAIELADALEAAHASGIVHRDIKPENIFITTRGTAKLLDFGIAKLAAERTAVTGAVTATGVGTGPVVLGTVAYMSPEQARGEPLDPRSDLFSLGAVLYEMATSTQPFRGATSGAVLSEILTKAPTAPVRLNPDVPADLERIVNKLLEKDRELRYQSARDLRVDLERLRRTLAEPNPDTRRPPATGPHGPTAVSTEVLPSIAVLPFVNMSGDKEQEYFSDGVAEEVINVLSRIAGLKVIARTSAFAFKNKQEDVRTIAGTLGVTNILEGSVRKAGNRVRVTAQLVTATDGSHLWSDRYDRDLTDIFAIQDEIAAAIAGALQVRLSVHAPPSGRRMANPEAYESYLKALYLLWKLSPEALARCKESLEHAIALDPGFALAHFGLAQHAWILASMGYLPAREAMPMVRTEAQQSLALDPGLADAHAMLGIVAAAYDYDWKEAERQFLMAISHDPVPSNAHSWYALLLSSADWPHPRSRCPRQAGAGRRSAEHVGACLLWNLPQRGRQAGGGADGSAAGSGHRGEPDVRLYRHRLLLRAAGEVGGSPRSCRAGLSARHSGQRTARRCAQAHGGRYPGGGSHPGSDERPVLRCSVGPWVVLRDSWRTGQVGRVVRKGGGAPPSGCSPSLVSRVANHFPMARAGETDESPGEPRGVTGSSALCPAGSDGRSGSPLMGGRITRHISAFKTGPTSRKSSVGSRSSCHSPMWHTSSDKTPSREKPAPDSSSGLWTSPIYQPLWIRLLSVKPSPNKSKASSCHPWNSRSSGTGNTSTSASSRTLTISTNAVLSMKANGHAIGRSFASCSATTSRPRPCGATSGLQQSSVRSWTTSVPAVINDRLRSAQRVLQRVVRQGGQVRREHRYRSMNPFQF